MLRVVAGLVSSDVLVVLEIRVLYFSTNLKNENKNMIWEIILNCFSLKPKPPLSFCLQNPLLALKIKNIDYLRREESEWLRSALDRLPPEHRPHIR